MNAILNPIVENLKNQREQLINLYNAENLLAEELKNQLCELLHSDDKNAYMSIKTKFYDKRSKLADMRMAINGIGNAISHLTGESIDSFWGNNI